MRFFNKQAIESLDLEDIQKAVAHAYSLVLEVLKNPIQVLKI